MKPERKRSVIIKQLKKLPLPHNWRVQVTGAYAHITRPIGKPDRPQLLVNILVYQPEGRKAIAHYVAARWYWLEELCLRKAMELFRLSDALRAKNIDKFRQQIDDLEDKAVAVGHKGDKMHEYACAWMEWAEGKKS